MGVRHTKQSRILNMESWKSSDLIPFSESRVAVLTKGPVILLFAKDCNVSVNNDM